MGRLDGKRALVSGTGGGIGRATALLLAREGAHVVGCDLNEETSAETVRLARAAGGTMDAVASADLGTEEGARSWVETAAGLAGGIDILVMRGEPGYERARVGRIFNARRPDRFPAAVLEAASDDDVIEGVRLAGPRAAPPRHGVFGGGERLPDHVRDLHRPRRRRQVRGLGSTAGWARWPRPWPSGSSWRV